MNVHLKNAELVRVKIEDYLPPKGAMDFDKLNINVRYLINTSKHISQIPLSMAAVFAQYSMANFASQFQWKINLDGSKIPTNVISFLLSSSGNGKDSTANAQEAALSPGYTVIEQYRKDVAMDRARAKAEVEGEPESFMKHYKEPLPLENSISTAEGLTSRLNQFSSDAIGMPSIMVSELGSELQSNPNMTDNIRLISELYDAGNKKSKAIKDNERQDKEVKGMGMNALFVGSEDNIILDKSVSAKFKTEFITKLARRTFFVYPTHDEFANSIVSYATYEDMMEKQNKFEDLAREGKAYIGSASLDMATTLLDSDKRLLEIDDDALQVYKDYKMYTNSLGNGLNYLYKSVQIEQTHRSWKALKLAGVYALWDMADSISVDHLKESIYFCEVIGDYLAKYEEYAAKENYELLLDYFKIHPEQTLSLHQLKKRDFISGNSNLNGKITELVRLSDSLAGSDGIVKFEGDTMFYKPFERVGEHAASYVKVSGSKDERATQCHSGFEYKVTTFAKLANMLNNDVAYTPFKFLDGKRKNDNIASGATWIAIDVDDSDITIDEMFDMLGDYNCHIATTSNSDNPYKFRIIIEFNNIVDLEPRMWKMFGKVLGEHLGIKIDPVTFTKSQIMFGYKGARVLTNLEGDKFDVSECVKEAEKIASEQFNKKPVTRTQMRAELDDPVTTFSYAFRDKVEARSLTLFRLWRHAKDLGARPNEAEQLMRDVNYDFWIDPVPDERFDSYVRQMRHAYESES